MRETTCRPLAFCASVSPKRVSPRIAPLTSPSARSSALKSGEEIMGGNGMTSTSSRVFSTSNPPAPMLMGTTRRLRLVGMQLPLRSCSPDEAPRSGAKSGDTDPAFRYAHARYERGPHSAGARAAPQGGGTTMKVTGIETLHCDAGWRNYSFVKLTTDEGIVGWSEYDEGFGSPGVTAAIKRLAERVVGQDVSAHERIYAELYCVTRPAAGGVVAEAMGAIENALLDAKAKRLGVPCYELLGGKQRDRIRLYWSHCATWRINHPDWYKPAITDLDGVKAIGREVREKGFGALKTNIFIYENGRPQGWRPGFGRPFYPELNVDKKVLRNLRMHLEALDDGAGPDVNLMLISISTPRPKAI